MQFHVSKRKRFQGEAVWQSTSKIEKTNSQATELQKEHFLLLQTAKMFDRTFLLMSVEHAVASKIQQKCVYEIIGER